MGRVVDGDKVEVLLKVESVFVDGSFVVVGNA